MMLSNKILLGFFGFVFIYLTAAFAELRIKGTNNRIDDKNSVAETVDLSGVKFLIINNIEKEINVIGSDRGLLEVRSISGNSLANLEYKISGDTLILTDLETDHNKSIKISVFIPDSNLRGISLNRSVAVVEGIETNLLRISQNASTLWMSESQITRMEMDLSASHLDVSATTLDTVSAQINASEVSLNAAVGLLQGSMVNGANLRLTDIREIQLKKDQTSNLNLYQ